MSQHERLGWIALSLIHGIGSVLAHKLSGAFGSPQAVFEQSQELLAQQERINSPLAATLARTDWQKLAQDEIDLCSNHNVSICSLADDDYPELLRAIPFPPPVFYFRGSLQTRDKHTLAVVGSRRPTPYGIDSARELVSALAKSGMTIVSGLAMGIDTVAHESALQAGARTLAVVAHGLDHVYPRINRRLFERISCQGAVISEFRLGVLPRPAHFPQRNRLISGLAQGVLVVEAGPTSGSLITARWAGEQNRDVFAVPGTYRSKLSQGTHALIRDGAKLVTSVEDIFNELPKDITRVPEREKLQLPPLQGLEADVFQRLPQGGMHVDQLALVCAKPVNQIMLALLQLEIKGRIRSEAGQIYHPIGESTN